METFPVLNMCIVGVLTLSLGSSGLDVPHGLKQNLKTSQNISAGARPSCVTQVSNPSHTREPADTRPNVVL